MTLLRRIKNKDDEGNNNNIFWTTLSDLMLGLAIVFIAMFVLAITGFSQNSIKAQQNKMEVAEKIELGLKEQLEKQNANPNAPQLKIIVKGEEPENPDEIKDNTSQAPNPGQNQGQGSTSSTQIGNNNELNVPSETIQCSEQQGQCPNSKETQIIQIDKMTGSIEIPAAALFDLNSYVLKPEGKVLLDKLAPVYINTIFSDEKLTKNVENIIIQGFTDSQTFAGVSSEEKQFLLNMELSLKRANAVAEYMILHTGYDKKYAKDFRGKLAVEGNSFNNLIYDENGKEDYNKSRRVELKLKIKDWSVASVLGLEK